MTSKKQNNLKSKTLLVVHKKGDETTSRYVSVIRVVEWIGDERTTRTLEKRQFVNDKKLGRLTVGRCRGFSEEEFRIIVNRQQEILDAFSQGNENETELEKDIVSYQEPQSEFSFEQEA